MGTDQPYVLYAARGWGSVLVEAMLALCGADMRIEQIDGFDHPGENRSKLLAVNPLAQVPTLLLPDGTVMTESAAIALLLAESFPEAGLAPAPDDVRRPIFLRHLIWLVANIYPTFTFADYPERWVERETDRLIDTVRRHREALWRMFEAEIDPGPWVLGDLFSVLDIYVCAMTHWYPRRAWFEAECPKLHAIALACEADARLSPVWTRNFGPETA
ncbi:glutathione S-transferase family protein [Sphingomonas oleivorans]|uniref:glutathione S-transferase family protein n=1 Tax=Sphingomonas oleivorans TaxID=1735121 RepID=UPI001A9D8E9B|nr:glutathione S-transferase family protein [Sphingomonas oleivorans]